jgi:hypothetical protein
MMSRRLVMLTIPALLLSNLEQQRLAYAWLTGAPAFFNVNTAGSTVAFRAVTYWTNKPSGAANSATYGTFFCGLGAQLSGTTQPTANHFVGFAFIPATDPSNWRF